jgi:hypothetical protein
MNDVFDAKTFIIQKFPKLNIPHLFDSINTSISRQEELCDA